MNNIKNEEVMLVEAGTKTFIGKVSESSVFPNEEGFLVLKDIRLIQGQVMPVNNSNVRGLDGKPLPGQMAVGFLMFPFASDTMVFLEDNIFGFCPITRDNNIFKMYEEELKNKNYGQ